MTSAGRPASITVVGDVLLDIDIVGTVERVCPDAPVPVVDVEDEVARPGGAGLAAALLAADGHDVTLVATIGADAAGRKLADLLRACGVLLVALPTAGQTREKVRVRADRQSLVRLDRGTPCPPANGLPPEALDAIAGCDAVLVSDYAGGMTADDAVRTALSRAASARPVVWDPHQRGGSPVPGCRLITPNEHEVAALASMTHVPAAPLAAVCARADALLGRWKSHAVCVTMGARGALLTYGSGSPLVVPAEHVTGADPCGAGDRFAATAVASLADGEVVSSAVQQAVAESSVFVATGGAAGFAFSRPTAVPTEPARLPSLERVRATGGTVVATGGCFDLLHAGHVAVLRAARGLGDFLVVCLNSDESVRRLKGAARPLVPQADRARVLEALTWVDAVVTFDEDTPERVLQQLRPDVWVKGGDYALTDLPETGVVESWGGQTVVLPYLTGRSTTALIGAANRAHLS